MELNLVGSDKLPKGWVKLCLKDVRRKHSTTFNPARDPNATLELYSVPSHETGKPEIVRSSEIGSSKQYVGVGDVLLSKINPRLNRSWVVGNHSSHPKIASTEWIVFEKNETVLSSFLQYILTDCRIRDYLSHNASGVGGSLTRVKPSLMDTIFIGLPPSDEQYRVVAKIEALFSELDKGVESLKTAREQLKIYRQAVLKHAFEGKLTAHWREENADKLESPEQLLARIQQEREARYQQQLQEWKIAIKAWEKNGKEGKKPGKPNKFDPIKPLSKGELEGLPNLPNGWTRLKVGNLCDVVRGGSPRPAGDKRYYDGEIPFLKVADLTRNSGNYLSTYSYTIKKAGLQKTRFVRSNTLLISNSGATLGVPKICLIGATFNDGIAAFLGLREDELLYHFYFWLSKTSELRAINQGAAQPNLNTDLLKEILIPICSTEEMTRVAKQIEHALSVCDHFLSEINESLSKSQVLRQSILKKAFSGKLVFQDTNDEPTALLIGQNQLAHVSRKRTPKTTLN